MHEAEGPLGLKASFHLCFFGWASGRELWVRPWACRQTFGLPGLFGFPAIGLSAFNLFRLPLFSTVRLVVG